MFAADQLLCSWDAEANGVILWIHKATAAQGIFVTMNEVMPATVNGLKSKKERFDSVFCARGFYLVLYVFFFETEGASGR